MNARPEKTGAPSEDAPKTATAKNYHACTHATTLSELMPLGHVHHAAERCAHCSAFIRWLPRPSTIARRQSNAIKLSKLGLCAGLNGRQRNFIRDLSRQQCLSPRQQRKLDEIAATHLKEELAS